MMLSQKIKYLNFVDETDIMIPVFFQPWYLDVVCANGSWDVILFEEGDGAIAGFGVFYITKKYGQPGIINPPLTPYSGIWICPISGSKLETKNKKVLSIINHIIERIPKNITLYNQSFHYSFVNGLPFYWKKYSQTVRYTFYIDHLKEWSIHDLATNVRNKIQKASRSLHYELSHDRNTLYDLVSQIMTSKGIKFSLKKEMFFALDNAILKNADRRIITIKDKSGHVHASTYILLYKDIAFMMLIGSDKRTRQNGAVPLAIYHSILEVQPLVKHFDFEGSMLESLFDLFAGFGGELKPYHRIYKAKNIFWDIAYRIKNHYDKNIR